MLRTSVEQLLGLEELACLHLQYARLDASIRIRCPIPAQDFIPETIEIDSARWFTN